MTASSSRRAAPPAADRRGYRRPAMAFSHGVGRTRVSCLGSWGNHKDNHFAFSFSHFLVFLFLLLFGGRPDRHFQPTPTKKQNTKQHTHTHTHQTHVDSSTCRGIVLASVPSAQYPSSQRRLVCTSHFRFPKRNQSEPTRVEPHLQRASIFCFLIFLCACAPFFGGLGKAQARPKPF